MNICYKSVQVNYKTGERYFIPADKSDGIVYHGFSINYPPICPIVFDIEATRPVSSKDREFMGEDGSRFTKVCDVENIRCEGFGNDSSVKFLTTPYFTNVTGKTVGITTAQKMVSALGINVFSEDYFTEGASDRVAKSSTAVNKESVDAVIRKLSEIKTRENVYTFIASLGGDLSISTELFAKHGSSSIECAKKNPYVLLDCGAKIEMCDELAYSMNMSYSSPERIAKILGYITWNNEISSGNTMMSFEDLCNSFWRIEDHTKRYHTSPLYIANALIGGGYKMEETADHQLNIWRKKTYDWEQIIENNALRLLRTATPLVHDMLSVEDIEGILGIQYSADQKDAFGCGNTSGVKIVTGGPGTGKTAFLNGLLKYYEEQNPGRKILLCAPTGCAAMRMKASTGRDAVTIHSALHIKPYEDTDVVDARLDADLVVVDEGSMMDTFMAACLLKSIKNGALLLIMGDADQLPSVGCGNVFHDMIESGLFEVYRFNTIFRQKGKSTIIENSKKIINGDHNLLTDSSFSIVYLDNDEELSRCAQDETIKGYERDGFKVFSPVRKNTFETSTTKLNNVVHSSKRVGREVSYNGYKFSEGDIIMFTKNNRELGVVNGQEGVIKSIQCIEGEDYMSVETEGVRITLSGSELSEIELAYAITAHKSQGSEIDNALIVIPEKPAGMLKRQLLYVEVTRAKKSVKILCTKNSLAKAISEQNEKVRTTGLFKSGKSA